MTRRGRVPADLLSLVRKELIRPERSTLGGRGCLPIPTSLDPRLCVRGDPEGPTRGSPRTPRGLAGARAPGTPSASKRRSSATTWSRPTRIAHSSPPLMSARRRIGRRAATALDDGGAPSVRAWRLPGRGEPPPSSIGRSDLPDAASGRRPSTTSAWRSMRSRTPRPRSRHSTRPNGSRPDSGDVSLEWLARIWPLRGVVERSIPTACPREECRVELEEAIREFEELGDETGLATAWTKLAFLEFIPCRYDRAERAARRSRGARTT